MVPTISLSKTLPLAFTCKGGFPTWGVNRYGVPLSCPQDRRHRTHQKVNRLYDINEDLILFVLDALGAPRHSIGDRRWYARLPCLQLVALLCDVLLQDLAVRGLRKAEVHELVQQLVHDDEVVPDALLLQLLKVLAEDLGMGPEDRHHVSWGHTQPTSKQLYTAYCVPGLQKKRLGLSHTKQLNEEKGQVVDEECGGGKRQWKAIP